MSWNYGTYAGEQVRFLFAQDPDDGPCNADIHRSSLAGQKTVKAPQSAGAVCVLARSGAGLHPPQQPLTGKMGRCSQIRAATFYDDTLE